MYYPDTVSGYPWTVPSIPLILSGHYYDNTEPLSEYIKRAYLEKSFLTRLVNLNYKVELYQKFYDFNYYKSREIATNVIRKGDVLSSDQATGYGLRLIDLALFKFSPHILKKHVYNDNQFIFSKKYSENKKNVKKHIEWLSYDREFVQKIDSNSKLLYKQPTYKFFHLRGAHAPWFTDENGKFLYGDKSRKNYRDHVIYKFKLIKQLFNKFKQLGIYDDSIIYLISDHGAGRSIETKLKTEILDTGIPLSENSNVPYQVKARAVNMFLKKLPNSKGGLEISDRAFSNSEFPAEVLKDLGMSPNQAAKYINLATELDGRRYFYYLHRDSRKYLPSLYEFIINGNSWLDSSWNGPINIYTKTGIYNKLWLVVFDSNSEDYFPYNNKYADGTVILSRSDREYFFNFKNRSSDNLLLNIALNYKEEIIEQNIEVYINEKKLDNIKTQDNYTIINKPYITILINQHHLNDDINVIKLRFKNPPNNSFADVIHSIGVYELGKRQVYQH